MHFCSDLFYHIVASLFPMQSKEPLKLDLLELCIHTVCNSPILLDSAFEFQVEINPRSQRKAQLNPVFNRDLTGAIHSPYADYHSATVVKQV